MKLIVLVPSKGRAEQLEQNTGSWLFPSEVDYRILVEPQDFEEYSKVSKHLIVLPENNRGLEYSMQIGKEWAEGLGYDVIFKVDDDIKGWADTYDKLDPRGNTERFQLILKDIRKPLENPNCVGISFPYRQEFWHDKRWMAINQRFQTCYVVKTEAFQPKPDFVGRGMWEDMLNFLRVIKDGKKVLRYGRYAMDTTVDSGMTGGLNGFYRGRTAEQYKAVIEEVKKEFPWLQFRQKNNGMIEPNFDSPMVGGKKL